MIHFYTIKLLADAMKWQIHRISTSGSWKVRGRQLVRRSSDVPTASLMGKVRDCSTDRNIDTVVDSYKIGINLDGDVTGESQAVIWPWLLRDVLYSEHIGLECSCVCVLDAIQLFPLVFYLVRAVHEFDFMLVLNWRHNKWRPAGNRAKPFS